MFHVYLLRGLPDPVAPDGLSGLRITAIARSLIRSET